MSFGVLGSLGIPGTSIRIAVLVMIVFVIVAFILERKTVFGRRIYLIGANQEAARLSGINVTNYLTLPLHPQCPAGRHYRDPDGLRIQGGCLQPGNGL